MKNKKIYNNKNVKHNILLINKNKNCENENLIKKNEVKINKLEEDISKIFANLKNQEENKNNSIKNDELEKRIKFNEENINKLEKEINNQREKVKKYWNYKWRFI